MGIYTTIGSGAIESAHQTVIQKSACKKSRKTASSSPVDLYASTLELDPDDAAIYSWKKQIATHIRQRRYSAIAIHTGFTCAILPLPLHLPSPIIHWNKERTHRVMKNAETRRVNLVPA
jgi:hypothetical protein